MMTFKLFLWASFFLSVILIISAERVDEYKSLPLDDDGFVVVEGDIEVDPDRDVQADVKLWTNGVVPYVISDRNSSLFREQTAAAIQSFEQLINNATGRCITFVPRTTEKDYLYIRQTRHSCSSRVGRRGDGKQWVRLSPICAEVAAIVQHELLHALGFDHEQSRPDRDTYVSINLQNVRPTYGINFIKYQNARTWNTSYDYGSVMHYNVYEFGSGEKNIPVITPLKPHLVTDKVGQRWRLSQNDVLRVQRLYQCEEDVSRVAQKLTNVQRCSFDEDECQFVIDNEAGIPWTVTSDSESGPNRDSTTGLGSYALAQADGNDNKVARLYSRELFDQVVCVQVYVYNYKGNGTVTLNYLDFGTTNRNETIATYRNELYPTWYRRNVEVKKPEDAHIFLITFEATPRGTDLAIDDVTIYPGRC